jgi:ribosomal protein S18 acetylase RimI-like enzyme
MQTQSQPSQRAASVEVRALAPADLDDVVKLDAALSREPRPRYFQKRLDSALQHPAHHLQVAAQVDGRLVGCVLARVGGGEFGGSQPTVTLETISVDPAQRHLGAGAAMHSRIVELARHKKAGVMHTQVEWMDAPLLGFLAHQGWKLSGRQVLQRTARRLPALDEQNYREDTVDAIRALRPTDVDAVLRLDCQRTGQDRGEWLRRKTMDALHDSAMAVSLVAVEDTAVVGFCLAQVDHGAYGNIQPRAVLEAINVQQGFEHKGYARALVNQLITNLGALLVEDVETTVDWDHFQLLGFFRHLGFGPSQRLALSLRL